MEWYSACCAFKDISKNILYYFYNCMLLLLLEQIENLTFCIFLSSLSLFTHNPHVIIFSFTKSGHNCAYCCQVIWFSFTYYNMLIFFLVCTFVVVVQLLTHIWLFVTPWTLQHTKIPCPSPSPWVCSNSCPLSRWCHPTISSSVIPFSCLRSSQHQGLFQWVSSLLNILVNIQDWSPLRLTGLISL